MSDLVDWPFAAKVATHVAARRPGLVGYERRALEADLVELTAEAEGLVAEETGLVSAAGPARARVTDRPGWVQANVASFQRLLRPVTDKLEAAQNASPIPRVVGAHVSGTQVGLLLGWLSTRVLGQYDQLLIEDERPEDQDIVYYVGPNIVGLERRFGFPPREFRLWLALHEVTHRAQFTGVPWMRDHFLSLVNHTLESVDPDPKRIYEGLRRGVEEIREGRNPLDEGGLLALLATPEQHEAIQEVAGLMSLLEGHGDVTMNRAAADRIPNAQRFSRVLHERRQQAGMAKLITSLIGLDAKLRQYAQGEAFIEEVEAAGGRKLLSRVWEAPQWLPNWPEIREPRLWIERATPGALAAG
jgi:coenzyme F420 biosynthesis associated uncharacterized protein